MIGWLSGVLRARRGAEVVVDCGGVGYLVTVPVGVAGQAALGDSVELHIQTRVREDDIALYGFETVEQHAAFDILCAVTGVGPKVAVGILGALGPAELAQAVESNDVLRLKAVKGVGKKLAERLSLELKGTLTGVGVAGGAAIVPASPGGSRRAGVWGDVASALTHLQYTPREIDSALQRLSKEHPEGGQVEQLVVAALGLLRRG